MDDLLSNFYKTIELPIDKDKILSIKGILGTTVKFSQFPSAAPASIDDVVAGLQGGINVIFDLNNLAVFMGHTISIEETQVVNLVSDLASKLVISNNLSDVANTITAASNLGMSNGFIAYSDNASHTISFPIPEVISITGYTIAQNFQFPNKSSLNNNTPGRLYFVTNQSPAPQNFIDYLGNPLFTVNPDSNCFYTIPDTTSSNWYYYSLVSSVNGETGNITVINDLQDAYNNSASPQINGSITFTNGTSTTNITGNIVSLFNLVDTGAGGTVSSSYIYGNTPFASTQLAAKTSTGFTNESVNPCAYQAYALIEQGMLKNFLGLYGSYSGNGPRIIMGGPISGPSSGDYIQNVSIGIGITGIINQKSVFQVASTIQGAFPVPSLTTAQETTLVSTLASIDNGIQWYNTDVKLPSFFDGTSIQRVSTAALAFVSTIVTTTTESMLDQAAFNVYMLQGSSSCVFTLPTTGLVVGHAFRICGGGTGLWTLAQNAGQYFMWASGGSATQTVAGTGHGINALTSADCIEFCYAGSGQFMVINQNDSGTLSF